MAMLGMVGATLVGRVEEEYPGIGRIDSDIHCFGANAVDSVKHRLVARVSAGLALRDAS